MVWIVVALIVLAAFAIFVATRPADFRVSRSRLLGAPPSVVHAHIDDFHKWPAGRRGRSWMRR